MFRKNKVPFIIIFIIICVLAGSAAALSNGDTIYQGVKVDGVNVGGLTVTEASDILKPAAIGLNSQKIVLKYEKSSVSPAISELGGKADVASSVQNAYDVGRKGNVLERILEVMKLWKDPIDIPIDYAFNENTTVEYLNSLSAKINKSPVNASVKLSGDKIVIVPEQSGIKLDVKSSARKLIAALDKGDKQSDLVVVTAAPSVKAADLKQINGLLASYSTKFKAYQRDRSYNLKLACKAVNGFIFKPGEIFSYNAVLGPREKKYGYRDAPIFVNGGVEDGTGGGICQVSTTVYNAALLANLKIVRRAPHSRPVVYAPIGRDATVAYPSVDLRIQNNTKAPIYISAVIVGSSVKVSFYGMKIPGQTVTLESAGHQVIKYSVKTITDGTLAPGKKVVKQSGRSGHKISIYRIVKQNGKVVKRELVAGSYYRPETRIVLVAKPAPKPKPKPIQIDPTIPKETEAI